MSWTVMDLIRQNTMDRQARQQFAEESAIRQLQRQRMEQEFRELDALPGNIAEVMRASQGGPTPSLVGTTTPVAPMDVSDLAGQNLVEVRNAAAPRTFADLSQLVPATSLANIIKHRPQTFGNLGLQTPQAVQKADLQQAGRKKIAGILAETPTTPEQTSQWWDRITGAWVEHGLDKTDDILEARMKMKALPADESAKTTAFFLTTRNAYRQAGHDEDTSFAAAVNDTATAFPRGGAVLKELAEKFKPGKPEKTPAEIEAEAAARKRGEVSATPKKTPQEIEDEAAARKRGERAGESPDERRVREAYLKSKADYLDSIRSGKPRNLQTVTQDIRTFEHIRNTLPKPADLEGMDETKRAEEESRAKGVTSILDELYQEYDGLRRQRPMPGRERVPQISNPSDAGTSRPSAAPPVTDLGPSQAAAPKLAPTEDNRARIVAVVKKLFPNKTYAQLTPAEKRQVATELAKGQ